MSLLRTRKLADGAMVHIVDLIHDTYGPRALRAAWEEFGAAPREFTATSPFLEHFVSWLAHTWAPAALSGTPKELSGAKHVPTYTFLMQHQGLDAVLAKYLEGCITTPFSFFEAANVDVGRSFTCCDLICGTRHAVVKGASCAMLPTETRILYARIVEVEGVPILEAAGPWALSQAFMAGVLALRDKMLGHTRGEPSQARQSLLAHELDLRSFYWESIEQALKNDSLGPRIRYDHGFHKAVDRLIALRTAGMTPGEIKAENERLLNNPEMRERIVSMLTALYENSVNERVPFLGNKTALEAVHTLEGRLKVEALMTEIEGDLSRLPFALDPEVFRRVRKRLGLFARRDLN